MMRLDTIQVVDAGQLHQDLVGAQAIFLDHRLAHAQGVDAVADGLDRLRDGLLSPGCDSMFGFMVRVKLLVGAAGDVVLVAIFRVETWSGPWTELAGGTPSMRIGLRAWRSDRA